MSNTVTPPLPPDLQQFLQREVACGNYVSENDVVVDALRLLQEERSDAIAALKEALAEMEAGKAVPLREALANQEMHIFAETEQCRSSH